MPQVSRYPLAKDVYFEILDELFWLLTEIKNKEEMKTFLYDFFTKTERIMLAKRLAVALMLTQGYSYSTIKELLKVSTGTVSRTSLWLEKGGEGLKKGLAKLAKKEEMEKFWRNLNRFLENATPKLTYRY